MKKNWLEWTVFGGSLVLVAAIVGYLGYKMAVNESGPPRLRVETGTVREDSGLFVMPVTVRNEGHQTAENVRIEVRLETGGTETETGDFSVDFVPRQSERSGEVVFTHDPGAADRVMPSVKGYEVP